MYTFLDPERIIDIAEFLYVRHFVLYRIRNSSLEFITSDNPVMFVDGTTKDATPFSNGLRSPNTIAYYPISPKLLLGAMHPNIAFGVLSRSDCRIFDLDTRRDANFISTINRKQIEQCFRQAFAKSEDVLKQHV